VLIVNHAFKKDNESESAIVAMVVSPRRVGEQIK
jgi:hypothetical protein